MNKKNIIFILLLPVFLLSNPAWGFEPLTDQELNAVTAGTAVTGHESLKALSRIPFHYSSDKASVDGEIIVLPMTSYNQTATLQLTDNAQSNLNSLININAVSSPINILMNLNINVNSTIGKLNQLNYLISK